MSEMNIYQRINAVMKEVEYVQKDGHISGGGANYKAVTHDNVTAVLRPHLVKFGIVVRVSQVKGKILQMRAPSQVKGKILQMRAPKEDIKMHLYQGEYDISFVNIDKPEEMVTVRQQAHANDNGDKAPGKAESYATKYAMLKTFSLETGENEEGRYAEEDCSDAIEQLSKAENMEELANSFRAYWNLLPKSRAELTEAKDARKKELSDDSAGE